MMLALPSPAQSNLPAALDVTLLAGQLAPASIAMYQRDLRIYVRFAHDSALDPLLPTTLARWRASLSSDTLLSPNTINRMLSAVKRILREAAAHKMISNEAARAFAQVSGVKVAALKSRVKANAAPASPPRTCAKFVMRLMPNA